MTLFRILFSFLFLLTSSVVWADDFVSEDQENDITGTSSTDFTLDSSDIGGNVQLQFGETLGEFIQWNDTDSLFEISDSFRIGGNIEMTETLFTLDSDNVGVGANVSIVANQGSDNDGEIRYNASTNEWEYSNDGGSFSSLGTGGGTVVAQDLAAVQARITTTLTVPASFTDVVFDTTDVENNASIVDHDNSNLDQIDILEDGLYYISYDFSLSDPTNNNGTGDVLARVRVNDATVLNGSEGQSSASERDSMGTELSQSFISSLTNGDSLSLQLQRTGSSIDTVEDGILIVYKMEAAIATADAEDDIFYAYDSGNTALASTAVDIPFDTEVREDTDYTHAADSAEVTINTTGNYVIDYECTSEVTTDDRSVVEHWIEVNTGGGFSEVGGTRAASYHRTTGDSASTASIHHYQSFTAGDIMKVVAQGDSNGNLQTVANGCRIKIERVDNANGLIGPQGPTGPQGPAGAAGTNGLSGGGWGEDGITTTTALDAQIDGALNVDLDLTTSNLTVDSPCGPYGIFWAERGTVGSNASWALGNGQTPWGSPMGCSGTVTRFSAVCTGTIGTSLDAVIRKNDVATGCTVNIATTVGQATTVTCNETFAANDVIGVYAGTESGAWTECVGTFWVKYD